MFKQALTLLGVTLAAALAVPAASAADIHGTRGDDVLRGTADADLILGLPGDDLLFGFAGADGIFGGIGRDALIGGADGDRLAGGPGRDLLVGRPGDDRLAGGVGSDVLFAGFGEDTLAGGRGRDVLWALAPDEQVDTLDCGPGFDVARVRDEDRTVGCERVVVVPDDSDEFAEAAGVEAAEDEVDTEAEVEATWDVAENVGA
jgi:Ca2+-binding RTX toxin-like protein